MKSISASLQTHIEGGVTSLASCWHIIRTDGQEFFFTDHDQDLKVSGDLYLASDGYNRSALKNSASLDTDEMELGGVLDNAHLSEEELQAGLYDYAEVRFFLVNWQDVDAGIIPLRKGWIGEVSWSDGLYSAELRGLSNALQRQIGAVYTPECTADLGDGRCKIDLTALSEADVIASVVSSQAVTLSSFAGADGALNGGILQVTSGLNAGRKSEIQDWVLQDKNLTLFLPLPFDLEVGDSVIVSPGCDKSFSACRDRYANQVNFRGFPHIPGTDALLEEQYE